MPTTPPPPSPPAPALSNHIHPSVPTKTYFTSDYLRLDMGNYLPQKCGCESCWLWTRRGRSGARRAANTRLMWSNVKVSTAAAAALAVVAPQLPGVPTPAWTHHHQHHHHLLLIACHNNTAARAFFRLIPLPSVHRLLLLALAIFIAITLLSREATRIQTV